LGLDWGKSEKAVQIHKSYISLGETGDFVNFVQKITQELLNSCEKMIIFPISTFERKVIMGIQDVLINFRKYLLEPEKFHLWKFEWEQKFITHLKATNKKLNLQPSATLA